MRVLKMLFAALAAVLLLALPAVAVPLQPSAPPGECPELPQEDSEHASPQRGESPGEDMSGNESAQSQPPFPEYCKGPDGAPGNLAPVQDVLGQLRGLDLG